MRRMERKAWMGIRRSKTFKPGRRYNRVRYVVGSQKLIASMRWQVLLFGFLSHVQTAIKDLFYSDHRFSPDS